jgi:hypothetical protein
VVFAPRDLHEFFIIIEILGCLPRIAAVRRLRATVKAGEQSVLVATKGELIAHPCHLSAVTRSSPATHTKTHKCRSFASAPARSAPAPPSPSCPHLVVPGPVVHGSVVIKKSALYPCHLIGIVKVKLLAAEPARMFGANLEAPQIRLCGLCEVETF